MKDFSRKRFLITLGLSVVIWIISGLIQALTGFSSYFTIFHKCTLTGYPIALCILSNDLIKISLISIVNILFWFLVVNLLWNWFKKSKT